MPALFDGFRQAAVADTPALLKGFLGNFYNIDQLGGNRVSDEAYRTSFNVAVTMSAIAADDCIATWQADFRADLPKIDVPVMVIQGDADQILPFGKTGNRLPGPIADMELVVVEGGPHGIPWTHADQVNARCPLPRPPGRLSRPCLAPRRDPAPGHRPFSLRFQRLSRYHGRPSSSGSAVAANRLSTSASCSGGTAGRADVGHLTHCSRLESDGELVTYSARIFILSVVYWSYLDAGELTVQNWAQIEAEQFGGRDDRTSRYGRSGVCRRRRFSCQLATSKFLSPSPLAASRACPVDIDSGARAGYCFSCLCL